MAVVTISRDWESVLTTWSNGPGKTEQEKAENAERAIKKAITASATLSAKDIRVFPQGSYRNRTNVRLESDVDICVCLMDSFSTRLDDGLTDADVGLVSATYTVSMFKNDVERAFASPNRAPCRGSQTHEESPVGKKSRRRGKGLSRVREGALC
jgi:predicted nucleotidyltransferase